MFVKRIAFCLLWFWVFYSMNAVAQQSILQDDDEYAIHAGVSSDASAAGQKKIITLQIFDKITGMSKEISISNRTETIVNLYHYEQEQLLIHGKLGSGGDVITFVHLPTSQVIDTIWGWDASISPDFTKIAYNFRYPPQSIPLYRTSVLLVYDLTKTPEENSMDNSDGNPTNRGFIIWPETNRLRQQYFIPAKNYEEQQHIISPIVWNAASTKVCFLMYPGDRERQGNPTYLILIDLSNGLNEPQISLQEVEASLFYKHSVLKSIKERKIGEQSGELNTRIPTEELRFTKDGLAIEIKPYGSSIFDGNTRVVIPIYP